MFIFYLSIWLQHTHYTVEQWIEKFKYCVLNIFTALICLS